MATTLAAECLAADTSVTLNVGHDAIATGDTLTIEAEQLLVSGAATGQTYPVERAQGGTTAADHAAGTAVTVTPASGGAGASICSQIASGDSDVTPPGFLPVPSHVFLGTCTDSGSEPTWQEVSNVESLTIPSPAITMLDVNNLANNSGVVLQIPGLATPGDIQLVVNYWPDDPTHDELTGLIHLSKTHEIRPFKLEDQYSDTRILRVTFAAYVTALPLPFTGTAPMKLTATLRQYGDVIVERVNADDGTVISSETIRGGGRGRRRRGVLAA
jgi:hypothetical protein